MYYQDNAVQLPLRKDLMLTQSLRLQTHVCTFELIKSDIMVVNAYTYTINTRAT